MCARAGWKAGVGLNILQVAPRYAPAWSFGGGVRMSYELAREWISRGHDVTVFTSDQRSQRERFKAAEEVLNGIRIRRFKNRFPELASRYPFVFFCPVSMRDALSRINGQYDVIHVIESRGPHVGWAARAAREWGIPLVWSAYGGLASGEGIRRLYRFAHDRLFDTASLVQAASGLIAQTRHEADVYRSFGADSTRIRIIPLAVSWREYEDLPPRGIFRDRIGIRRDQKLVLFLGRVHWTKGLQLLIPAFATAFRSMSDVTLVIAGPDCGFLANARNLVTRYGVSDRVLFLPAVDAADRLGAYVDADIFAITPPVYEETSLAALEACACGTPSVTTRQCEIPGLDEANAGTTVAYDLTQLTEALVLNLDDVVRRERSVNARNLVRTRFTSAVAARQHEEEFKRLTGQP